EGINTTAGIAITIVEKIHIGLHAVGSNITSKCLVVPVNRASNCRAQCLILGPIRRPKTRFWCKGGMPRNQVFSILRYASFQSNQRVGNFISRSRDKSLLRASSVIADELIC